jgi:glycine/D-amino acid oxidase-like deaminating enzyme
VAHSIGHSDANKEAYRVAIVGGGVVGLTSAVRLQEAFPNSRITIIADKVANETTSEGAAGLWKPYALSGTSTSK